MLSACAAGDAPRQVSALDAGDLPQVVAAKDRDLGQRVHRCGEHELKSRLQREYDSQGSAAAVWVAAGLDYSNEAAAAPVAEGRICVATAPLAWALLALPPPIV